MSGNGKVLLVDDEERILVELSEILEEAGYEVVSTTSPRRAIQLIHSENPDVVVLDILFLNDRELDGIDVLKIIKEEKPVVQVIILSGHGTIEKAVKAVKLGAFDFLEKPVSSDKILIAIKNALALSLLEKERKILLEEALEKYRMVGVSDAMRRVFETIERVAPTDSTVLITGESGTGKELVARAIHLRSPRAGGPFVSVNCAAIPEELIEAELFGYEKGAFTSAYRSKPGQFELAEGGTIFLDEVADLSPKAQAKVLRVLDLKETIRIGGTKPKKINVRIIAATNKDLKKLVSEGRFREDLFFRISVIPIHLPPLRERREDIPVLVGYFLKKYCEERKIPIKKIHPAAMEALISYEWKGNVRQLQNVIEAAIIFSMGEVITLEVLKPLLSATYPFNIRKNLTLKEFLRLVEKEKILAKLAETNWDYERAANELGLSRSTFFNKLREYGISKRKMKV